MDLSPGGLPAVRPPTSAAERAALAFTESGLREAGHVARHFSASAPLSPVLVPVLAALLRLATVALAWSGSLGLAAVAGVLSVLTSVPGPAIVRSRLLAKIPGLRGTVHGVFVSVPGSEPSRTAPLVIVARPDSHPAAPGPLSAVHAWLGWASALIALALVPAAWWPGTIWRWIAVAVAVEAGLTTAVCLSKEFTRNRGSATTGLETLVRAGELLARPGAVRDVWLVAAGGGTVGATGLYRFLDVERDAGRNAWVIVLEDTPSDEAAIVCESSRVPPVTTHDAAVRGLAQAAITSGEAVDVSPAALGSLEARMALRRGLPSMTLTGTGSARGAEMVDALARTLL